MWKEAKEKQGSSIGSFIQLMFCSGARQVFTTRQIEVASK